MLLQLSKSTIAANVILGVLATLAVSLQVVASAKQKWALKADDYVIVSSLIIALGLCASGIYAGATNLYADPVFTMPIKEYSKHEKLIWADVFLCHIAYGLIKISILLFYKRIFIVPWFLNTANVFMAVDIAWMLAATFAHIFSASPVDSWWNFKPGEKPLLGFKPSFDYQIFIVVMACLDIVLHFLTLLLPIPVIKSLNMSTKRKISLMGVFALGFFCVVSSGVRLYYSWRLHLVETGELNPLKTTSIFAWNDMWAHIEACASIVTACLPTLAPLATSIRMPAFLTSIRSLLTRWTESLRSSTRSHRRRTQDPPSLESLHPKQGWYKLNVRTEAEAVNSSDRTDEEALVEHPQAIRVQQSFGTT